MNNFGLSRTVHKSITCQAKPIVFSRLSQEKNLSKDKEMDLASGNEIISSFTCSMLQQPHVSHIAEVLTDVARMLLAIVE